MTLEQAMGALEEKGTDKMRRINSKNGVGENQFGLQMGDIRKIAKEIRSDHELGVALWRTGNWDAMLLATLLVKPKQLSMEELEQMVAEVPHPPNTMYSFLAEWVMSNVVKQHPQKEELRQRWMQETNPSLSRAGWGLTAERVTKNPDGLDLSVLLDRIEKEMGSAPPYQQWTMNFTLAQIGIEAPEHRERALGIGEKLGVFRDYPVSKGCTSPFAPIWITEMANRKA